MTASSSPPATPALFVTQAKGIQEYVLGTDKLRDMLGATELVENLTSDILQKTLNGLGLKEADYQILSRAAGSARVKFARIENAQSLAAIWPMVCSHATPGLEVYQTVQTLHDRNFLHAVRESEKALALARGIRQAELPVIGPPVKRSARTGAAAVGIADLPGGEREEVDAATRTKRKRQEDLKKSKSLPDVYRRMKFPEDFVRRVPDDFNQISGRDREYLALIHADGNGLGQLFIQLEAHFKANPDFPEEKMETFYSSISEAITQVSRDSASAAREEITPLFSDNKPWPVMPLVLAGDDITLVVRADLAIPFVKSLLLKFEEFSHVAMEGLAAEYPELQLGGVLPERLSSGAGIVFMKSGFPFSMAYTLCESVAKQAKDTAKGVAAKNSPSRPPSSLAFHKISASSIQTSYGKLLEHELRGAEYHITKDISEKADSKKPGPQIQMTMCPYYVGRQKPSLEALLDLVSALEGFPKGPPRELLALLQTDHTRALKQYERMLGVNPKEASAKLSSALVALVGADVPVSHPQGDEERTTPLGDALTLLGFQKKNKPSKK